MAKSSKLSILPIKSRTEQLLKQLENITNFNSNQQFPNSFLSLSAKIGIGVAVVLVVSFFMFLIWREKRTGSHLWKSRIRTKG